MTPTPQPMACTHIRLLADHTVAGNPVFEVLPARQTDSGLFELAGSPALVLGCAAGDVLQVADDGRFEVVERGENLCIQTAGHDNFSPESFAELRRAVEELGGLAEAPTDLRFIVVTVGRAVGLTAIEQVMDTWIAGVDGAEWWFGTADADQATWH